jgi:hypothetical protein
MSKPPSTPKPWTFRVKSEGNGFNVCENDSPFAVVHMTNDPSVAEARVRLTATAPELLAALYDVRRECILPSHIEAIVGAAIAKAERGS